MLYNSVLKDIINFFIIIIMMTTVCLICEHAIRWIYNKLQYSYIKMSDKKYTLFEKLLLINYKVSKNLERFFIILNPLKHYNENHKSYFNTKIFSYGFCDTLKSISIYWLLFCIIKIVSMNYKEILNFLKIHNNSDFFEILKNVLFTLYDNKWYILVFFSAVSIIYGIYKNKFTNKLVEELQDDELRKIIELYKKTSLELIKIEILLLENIKIVLTENKNKGIFSFLYTEAEKRYSFCEYDYLNNKLVVKNSCSSIVRRNIKLNDISPYIDNINRLFDSYNKSNHFYSSYAINKYFKGINQFDVEFFAKFPNLLLSNSYLNKCLENTFDNCDEILENREISKEYVVDILNNKIEDLNSSIYYTTIDTIEKVIKIDKFNNQLQKSMSLKKYRNKISVDSIISNIK